MPLCAELEDGAYGERQSRRLSLMGRRLCCLWAALGVHPAKASRIAANIAKLPELVRRR
jgi:hypothetical protein